MKGIYIHIPFCRKICNYCDFYKMVVSEKMKSEFIDYLLLDLDLTIKKYSLDDVDTIYIGGGTPSSLPINLLEKLFTALLGAFELKNLREFTIEVNPEDITEEFIVLCKKYFISRISIGVQTFQNENYKVLGRVTDFLSLQEKVKILEKHDLNNYSFDLIYAVPNSNIDSVKNDLKLLLELKPKHISTYSLILEEKTILSHLLKNNNWDLVDENEDLKMYNFIVDALKKEGFKHYETSNFSLPGYESNHNLIYWNCDDYYGIGPSAASLVNNTRFTKVANLKKYYNFLNKKEEPVLEYEVLDEERQIEDFIMLGLRKVEGIDLKTFKKRFRKDIFEVFPILNKMISDETIILENEKIKISEKYIYISNYVISKILFN